ncbi:hypothetical protein OAI86_00875 [Alphaproteobacteria bacterium]|nr:hypothetical protein [Alphaproteobacteria bacterium]
MSNDFFTTSNRIKKTPFTSRNEQAGVKKHSVYNNTLIPTIFKSLKSDYLHLIKHVQLWDVCCQKIIEIKGKKALSFVKFLFCRDFTKVVPGRAYYAPIVNFEGGLLNDPVVFCITEERFFISLSDSDLFNWVSAINSGMKFNAEVIETDILTIAVQGPKSEKVMTKTFGEEIKDLKFFNFIDFNFNNEDILISKTGFSKQSGYEILFSNPITGTLLWDLIMQYGQEFNIKVGCPNMIERVESNLLSYGNEMTNKDLPHDCGLGKYCNLDTDNDFIGKSILLKHREIGFKKSMFMIEFDFEASDKPPFFSNLPIFLRNEQVGKATSIVWSPKYSKYIGFLIMQKTLVNNINDYSILDEVSFEASEII